MRYFKIFIIALLSLIGVVGGIVGIMYLTGALNQKVVEPEAIYFEYTESQNAYNLADDTYIKILSSTEEVTETHITLSLGAAAQEGVVNGVTYITDGIIKVPKFVTLGNAFKIELCKEINLELGGEEWIVGGVSTLTAKSQSLKASQITTNVNVDVPVHSITVSTYANDSYADEVGAFAAGETFYAKANFKPAASAYKFGQDGLNNRPLVMKKVYFDPISSSLTESIVPNTEINNTLTNQGITNIQAFNAVSATENLTVYAYAFASAILEDECIETTQGDEDLILAQLKNSNVGTSAQKPLEIENVLINSFTIAPSLTVKTLKFNEINTIYANFAESSSSLNFGVKISSTNPQSAPNLQSKIKNIGVQVYQKSGSGYTKANNNSFVFVDSLGAKLEPAGDGYYFPTLISANVNKSYWNFVPLHAGVEYAFSLTILDNKYEPEVDPITTFDAQTMQNWQSSSIVNSTISWTNQDNINLTVIDSQDEESVRSEEFDLSSITSFTQGTYSIVRYIAYSNEPAVDLSLVISGARKAENYSNAALSLPENINIYELSSATIKLLPSTIASFNVRAVVLENDYLGRLTNPPTIFSATQPKTVNVHKTVKDLSVNIEVLNQNLLKNYNNEAQEPLTKLAFLTGTSENIFDIVFTVSADNKTHLDKEVEIFLNDLQNDKIFLSTYVEPQDQKNAISTLGGTAMFVSDTKWEYRIPYFAGSIDVDSQISFEYTYLQTKFISYTNQIINVVFPEGSSATMAGNLKNPIIELYDGKVFTLEFGFDNAKETPIIQTTQITGSQVCVDNVYFAESIERKYYFDNAEPEGLLDDTGEFAVIAKDKFGNQIDATNYSCNAEVDNDGTRNTYYLLSAQDYSSSLKTSPTDKLYFIDASGVGNVEVKYNQGTITKGIWTPSSIANDYTALSEEQINGEISVSRFGVKGQNIQISGDKGLLSVRYTTENVLDQTTSVYEFCNLVKYTIVSPQTAYQNVIRFNFDGEFLNSISILESINTEINLNISATTELGATYAIKLSIQPNITVSYTRITAQGALSSEPQRENNLDYFLMYSNNDVVFNLSVTFNLAEQLTLTLSEGVFANQTNTITETPTFNDDDKKVTMNYQLTLNFPKDRLGKQQITVSTNPSLNNQYVFKSALNLVVEPNVTFENTILNKTIEIKSFAEKYSVITNDDLKRILGEEGITMQDVVIGFAKTTEGEIKDKVYKNNSSSPLDVNIFDYDSQNNQLSLIKLMEASFDPSGEYTAYFDVKYGSVIIGEIKVKIASNISINFTNQDYSSRFAYYNAKEYLVLQSGETGISIDYIQNLFTSVDRIDFVVDGNYVSLQENKYNIKLTNNYVLCEDKNITLWLYDTEISNGEELIISKINFPVLISPVDAKYVTYLNAPLFNGQSEGLNDLSSLKDYTLLFSQNVYDVYNSGEDVSLVMQNGQKFGLSVDLINQIANGNYPYAICLQGENGQITNIQYGSYNKTTGVLSTLPSSKDVFVYFVVYDNNQQTNIIALYRFKVVANVSISVYYPYANHYQTEEAAQNAEYIYETLGEEITINLLEPLSNSYPNHGHKRIELSVYDEENKTYKEITAPYAQNFSLVSVNGNTELGAIKVNYGISLSNNVLTIGKNNPNRMLEIVLNCSVMQESVDMGNVNYIIRLNTDQTFTVKLGSQDFTEKTLTISKGEEFDYSLYQLYKQEGYISLPATNVDLGVYYYIENADVNDFIKEENKKLSLQDTAVSNKNVKFMFYTIYGEIHTLNLTFVSDYSADIKTNDVITLNPNTNALEVYADTEFSLKDVISLTKNQSQTINLTNIDIVYYDNGNFVESDIVLFPQITNNQEQHNLKVIIKLSQAGLGVKEDYEFNITLNVLKSIVSNYSNSPYEVEHITYNTTYKTSGYVFTNLLSYEFTDNVFLFESANEGVLKDYSLAVAISSNASGFASLDNSTSTLTKVYTDIKSIKEAFNVYLLKAPDDNNIAITITFILSKTYPNNSVTALKAYLKLVVVPDVSIAFSYPKANTQSTKQQESIFLSKQNYGSVQTKLFGFKNDTNYFGASRISLDWKNGVDNSRITLTATGDSNILINGQTESLTFGIDDKINLSWNTSQQPTQDMHAEVTFEVFVDEIYRGKYVIVFENNINKIFEVSSLLNLYDNASTNSELNPEIYYVDTKSIQGIFSRKTALLTFTNKAQAADVTLNAYAKGENSQKSLLGTITIGKTEQEINWLLFNTNIEIKEDLSNVVIQDEASKTEYHFGTDYTDPHNVMYRTAFIKQNSVSLKYRIGATYLNEPLSAENLQNVLKADLSSLSSYPISRSKATNLKELSFKVDAESLTKKYYYQVIYDFKVSNAYSTKLGEISNKVAKTITAPNSIGGNLANSAFGISAITGPFTPEYFQTHNVNYFAEIIMITNSQFETNQTSNNVNYIANGKLWFLQQYFPSLTAVSNSAPCAATSPHRDKFNNNKVYDFDLTAHGAENDGNYVYILVSYGTGTEAVEEITSENVSNFAFAIIKVKIEPNASSIELYNTDGNLNGAEPEQNQVINYENGRFADLKLGANGATKADNNLIYIYGSGTTNLINDATGNYATHLSLHGDIANYVYIDDELSNGIVYLRQKQDENGNYLMATYGDKSGFIQIEDMYGYKENYYITLKAANPDEAITLVEGNSAFIGQINGSQNNFYTGTEIMFIDANASVSLGEKGGVRAYNFKKLEEKVKNSTLNNVWTYQITFKIPEINFIEEKGVVVGSDSPQTTFTVPSISDSLKPVTLEIYITVSHNGAEEVILLQAPMIIQKRFSLTNTYNKNSSVQAGVSFDLSEYLSVQDAANLGASLGQANISDNVLTLRVKESAKDKKLTLSAVHDTDKNLDSSISITVGANFDGTPLSATNGYYYYILPLLSTYQNINFEDFKFSISSQENGFDVAGNAEFVADKIVTLTTSSVVGTPTVYVAINNGKNAYAIPYTLSKNGQQVKSLAEEKAKAALVNFITHSPEANPLVDITSCGYNGVEINKDNTIYKYNLASTPVSAEDMQTIKNFEIYEDSLVIKITNTNEITSLTDLDFTVEILLDSNVVGSATYAVTENISHYRYISVYDLLGEAFNFAENFDKEFTVRITYYASQNNLKSIISYNNQPAVYTKPIGNRYEYSLTSTFKFNKLQAGLTEKLDVLSASAFTDKIYSTKKYYLVKYLDQKVFEKAEVQFNVTPKYYGLSINEETTKFVYANQYTVNSDGIYTVDFNTWTSGINLVNRAGNVLNGLSNDLSLTFKINDGIGAGSGSASLDENWNLITTSSYKETEYFAIEVWVPVTEQESMFIGRFKVELSHNYVYVTNTNVTYMFIVTHPAATQTIEPTYYFTENATKISDLLFGENSTVDKDIVNKDTQTILIEGLPRKINECNISIVTIIDQIYSVNYVIEENDNGDNDEYLELKLKLNQTSSTNNKTVELQFDATSKFDKSTISRQELGLPAIKLTITKQSNANELIFDIASVNGSKCEYVGNGVYNLKLPFKEVFENMIGADYLFSAKVVGTMSTNAELLYAKRTQEQNSFTGSETFFFALSFVGMDNSVHHTLLASKYLDSMFETDGYFTLNLNLDELPVILDNFVVLSQSGSTVISNVKYYTIKFLGAQNIDLLGKDILITAHNSTNASTTFSIAKVLIDSSLHALPNYAFEIKINSEEIYNQVISNAYELNLTVYNAENTVNIDGKYLPKIVPLTLTSASSSVLAIQVNGEQNQNLVAVQPSGTQQILFDLSSWLKSGDYVTIMDMSYRFINLAPASGDNFFKLSGSYSSIIVKTSLTKAEKTGYNHYAFDNVLILKSNTITQITDNYDLTSLVTNPTANNFYSFAVQNASDASKIKYFMAKADENGLIKLSLLELSELLKDYASGEYFFAGVSSIENTSSLSEKTVYALTSTSGNITIKAFGLTKVSNNLYTSNSYILDGFISAKQLTNKFSITALETQTTYISTTTSLETTYLAVYYSEAANIDLISDVTSLNVGDEIVISISTSGFSDLPLNSIITFKTSQSDAKKNFNVLVDEQVIETKTIAAGEVSVVIDTSQPEYSGITTINNLTIVAS